VTDALLLPGLFGLAVVVAWLRLAVRRPAPALRLAALLTLQPVVAGLLSLTLVPPRVASSGTLVVATRGATLATALTGDRLVALPEAPALPGAERVPDLGTALRRHPAARLRVVGDGLTARDRDAVGGVAVEFVAPATPRGLVALTLPPPVAAGGAFAVGGQVGGIDHAAVDLIDPAGRRVDTAAPDAAGAFVVRGTARAAGPANFTLRVRDGPRLVETAAVPVSTIAAPPPRLLLVAGAPGPEVKYLRRWASDAGLTVHSEVATGAGLTLGDAPLPLTVATLAKIDVAVFDARSWSALSLATRAAVIAAVRAGLGLIVRLDGPLTDTARQALRPLGFAVTGGDDTVPVTPPPAADAAAQVARRGPGTRDDPASVNGDATAPPLARWNVTVSAPTATALRAADGAAVATWRAEGAGRLALWPLADSYRLVLAGDGDRYGELWSAAVATVGRGRATAAAVDGVARVGQRLILCGVGAAKVVAPDGRASPLLVDPPSGCAGFWPRLAGWHRVEQGGTVAPFFVAAAGALPNVAAMADTQATLALRAAAPGGRTVAGATRPGPSWPWFLAWLAASAVLWLIERAGGRPPDGEEERT
jgi:hypothetical protein